VTRSAESRLRGGSQMPALAEEFASDVDYYLKLSPRQLPSRYLYDGLGSALFDAICELPWYRVTRAEGRLLESHSRAVFAHLDRMSTITELGPGNGDKLRRFIEIGRRAAGQRLTLHLIDVSRSALTAAARTLSVLDDVVIVTHEAPYDVGLRTVGREHPRAERALVVFLGSNIGNFDRPDAAAFLSMIRAALGDGGALLIGADLVKPERELLLAYDDPLGVTAAFNRNLLVRINRELGGNFDVEAFQHRALWNRSESRVEMHLVARSAQQVRIEAAGLDVAFEPDEPIWTESSYKYQPEEIVGMLDAAGFRTVSQWINEADRFALTLAETIER
jgi:L-histidine Nalpha-methyltransferase